MIQRRRPIESAIAKRKMFNMGGMASPMQQPTYMDLMQQAQPMGTPQQGIMGMPRIMGMPQQAQPMGTPQQAQPMGTPQQAQGIMASSQPLVDAIAADAANPAGGDTLSMAQGGLASEDLMARGFAPGGLFTRREIPLSLAQRKKLGEEAAAKNALAEPAGLSPPPEAFAFKGTNPDLYTMESLYNPTDLEIQNYRNIYGKADLARRQALDSVRPSRNLLAPAYDSFTKGRLEADELARIREEEYGIKTEEFERIKNLPLDSWLTNLGASDKERQWFSDQNNVDLVKSTGISTDLTVDPNTIVGAFEDDDMQAVTEATEDDREIGDVDTVGGDRSMDDLGSVGGDRSMGDVDTVGGDRSMGDVDTVGGDPPAEVRTAPLPPTRPGAGPAEAAGTSPSDGGPQGLDEVIGGYNTAADQAASILNTDKKAGSKDIAAFKKEFMEAMPKYEGMSEEEKGFLIAEAGLRVMAGKSSDAIANIAKGLQGLGPALMKGAKEKRAWNRQVELSAAKYGLQGVAKEDAKADALAKEGRQIVHKTVAKEDFIDPVTKQLVREGQIYTVTRDQIDKDIYSKLPLTFASLYSAETTAKAKTVAAAYKKVADAAEGIRKENTIGYKEAKQIKESLGKAQETFVHASGGLALVENVIQKIVTDPEDIVGGKAAIKQAWGNIRNAFGNSDKKYNSLAALESDLKIAFQKVIPVALRNIQAGNSISDRDVSNLAQAFIAGGLINQKDGTFTLNVDLAAMSPEILVSKLQEMNSLFRTAQKASLTTFDQEIYNLQKAEKGRYGPGYFKPQLQRMAPALERYRAKQGGKQTSGVDSVLRVTDYFKLDPSGKVTVVKPLPKKVP